MTVKPIEFKLSRKLDGKGRLTFSEGLREFTDIAPDGMVEIRLVTFEEDGTAKPAFVITKKEEE